MWLAVAAIIPPYIYITVNIIEYIGMIKKLNVNSVE